MNGTALKDFLFNQFHFDDQLFNRKLRIHLKQFNHHQSQRIHSNYLICSFVDLHSDTERISDLSGSTKIK